MIKLCGDLHFGLRRNSNLFHKILLESLNWFMDSLTKEDHVIILGDIFDNRSSVDFKVLNDSITIFQKLISKCQSIHLLVGNHDLYYKENVIDNVNFRFLTQLNDKINVVNDIVDIKIDGKKCLFVPWLDNVDKMNIAKNKLKKKYDIVLGHFDRIGNYNGVNLDTTTMLDDSDFGKNTNILSGHFHRRSNKGIVTYVGSFINQSFSDVDDVKGYYTYDTDVKFIEGISPQFKYVNIPNSSAFLQGYNNADEKSKKSIQKNISGNFIQLILNEYSFENDEIYRIFKGMTPLEISVSYNRVNFEDGADKEGFDGFDSKSDLITIISNYVKKVSKKLPNDIEENDINDLISRFHTEFKTIQV